MSGSGLAQVGYVRLSVADDGNSTTALNFELDAVVIGNGFAGAPVPEPSVVVVVLSGAVALLLTTGVCRRRRFHA